MFTAADENLSGDPFLEVAFEAQDRVAFDQHPGIHRAVRLVTGRAPLTNRLMLKNKRTALRNMAPSAGVLLRGKRSAAANDHITLVRVVAVTATDLALDHRVMVGQPEASFHLEMTLEACLG